MKFKTILLFISSLLCFCLYSQDEIKFHTLSPKGGLSYDGIIDIQEDGNGFMWFMLDNNLLRFDGYQYKSYSPDFQTGKEHNSHHFYNITKDKQNNLLVTTQSGLFKFDRSLDKFIRIIDQTILYLHVDNQNQYWMQTSEGLAFQNEDEALVYPEFENRKLPLSRKVFCDNGDDLYLFSNYGQIYRYNRNSQLIETRANINVSFEGSSLADAKVHDSDLWMITHDFSIFKIDLSTYQISFQIRFPELSKYRITSLLVEEKGKLWVGTNNGIYIFDPKTKTIDQYRNSQNDKFSIPHNSVWTMTKDDKNNIWIGTYMGSVAYVNPHDFRIFDSYYLSANGLNKVPVSGFVEYRDELYIATEGGGINIWNKSNKQFHYLEQDRTTNSLSSNYTKSMVKDDDGNIWISTFRGGLSRYNPKKGRFEDFRAGGDNSVKYDNLRKIILDPGRGIWIIYQEHTAYFSFYSFSDGRFTHINLENKITNKMSNDYIYDICMGRNNKLWLLTSYSLIGHDIQNNEVTQFEIHSPENHVASTLCMDDLGVLWIGTFGNEMIRFNPETLSFKYHNNLILRSNSEIYSINHLKNKIWLGTNNGLYVFDAENESCKIFNESDGTQGDVYYPLATYKGENNQLYFGGTGGFTIVNPEKLGYNFIKPNVMISDFFIDNESIFDDRNNKTDFNNFNYNSPIILNHKQPNFGFKISSDNYLNTNKNQFRYRLKNFDNRWLTADAANRVIQYSKVPPGTYYFEAQTANNDGLWGNIISIKIIRKITPWLGIPALLLYFILFAAMVSYFIISYRKQKKLELKIYIEGIEREKNEEIHNNQLKFLTNISHDLKTPLTLIMATINRLREEGMKEYYYKILNSNSERLLHLLNDLLDFRKVQSNRMKLNVSDGNLNEFIKTLSADFLQYAAEKNIDFQIEAKDPNLASVYFDSSIMEKIILNLLNNAFKYTPEEGFVKIEAGTKIENSVYENAFTIGNKHPTLNDNQFFIAVRDTGVGISKASINKVFERYYRVKTNNEQKHLGTGIGLALVKELVLLHKGAISIFSERDRGTDFILQFSNEKEIYSMDEISEKDTSDDSVVIKRTKDISIPEFEIHNEKEDLFTEKDQKDKTILIAEDNVDLRMLIKSALKENYNIVGFNNGSDALEYLRNEDIDLIISDIMMPEMDGITFCKMIKENVETSHIPFVLLTAKTGIESRLEGGESGADLYFEKPIDFALLKLSIGNIFKQQEILREHYAKNYFANVSEITTNKEDNNFLTEVVRIISQHLDDPRLDVNFLAEKMTMSRSKLYSKLKTLTGKSIIEFILSNRLRHAAKLLLESDINIQEAMFAVGIESQSYFATAFRKEFGLPPSKFVAEQRESTR